MTLRRRGILHVMLLLHGAGYRVVIVGQAQGTHHVLVAGHLDRCCECVDVILNLAEHIINLLDGVTIFMFNIVSLATCMYRAV